MPLLGSTEDVEMIKTQSMPSRHLLSGKLDQGSIPLVTSTKEKLICAPRKAESAPGCQSRRQ